ncbi:MAG: PIN domain-containing protein [Candidatus Saccharibacteria bacterium]|nr:PIN domain-containing protein [Candidatus Saccharibacteria bacterium]
MIYAVIDTNVLVSAAIAKNKTLSIPYAVFRNIVQGKFKPILDDAIIAEYRKVLLRPKFNFIREAVERQIEVLLRFAINEPVPETNAVLPDMDDIIFYNAAVAHKDKSAYLVTGNTKHFPNCDFVRTPREFLNILTPERDAMTLNENDEIYDPSGLLELLRKAGEMAEKNGVADMTEEEIEAEIKAARAEMRARKA